MPFDLIQDLLPLLSFVGGIAVTIYAVAKKVWTNEDTLRDLVKAVCGTGEHPDLGLVTQMSELTARVSTIETQFNPFLKILEDSVRRMLLGGVKGNPINPIVLQRINLGLASLAEIKALDGEIAAEIEQQGPDTLHLAIARYWLALKKAEVQSLLPQDLSG